MKRIFWLVMLIAIVVGVYFYLGGCDSSSVGTTPLSMHLLEY